MYDDIEKMRVIVGVCLFTMYILWHIYFNFYVGLSQLVIILNFNRNRQSVALIFIFFFLPFDIFLTYCCFIARLAVMRYDRFVRSDTVVSSG